MLTRISKLPDTRCLVLGVDRTNVFEAGMIYKVEKLLDRIVLTPIGKYALPKKGPTFPNENSEADDIMYSGLHLITTEEHQARLQKLKEKYPEHY